MGGLATEITATTRNVLLEVANFEPASVRRTARAFDLLSDAARRFAWGLPPELAPVASARVCRLLAEHAGGRVAEGMLDVWPDPAPPPVIRLRRSPHPAGARHGGAPRDGPLHPRPPRFEVREEEAVLSVKPPYWRGDIRVPDDLVEEVARISGYDDLPGVRPLSGPIPHRPPLPARRLRERVRDLAADAGLFEVQTYSLVSVADLAAAAPGPSRDPAPPLRVRNPLAQGATPCGLPSVPDSCAQPPTTWTGGRGPSASSRWDGAIARLRRPAGAPPRNGSGRRGFSSARGWIVSTARPGRASTSSTPRRRSNGCCSALGVEASFRPAVISGFLGGRTAGIEAGDAAIGVLGQVHPETAAAFGVERDTFLWELDLSLLLEVPGITAPKAAAPLPRHPRRPRTSPSWSAPECRRRTSCARRSGIPWWWRRGFSTTTGSARRLPGFASGIAAGQRSLGIAVRYRAPNRTLDERDIAKIRRTILKRLKAKYGAVVREQR